MGPRPATATAAAEHSQPAQPPSQRAKGQHRSEGLPLRDMLSLCTLVGGWVGWECSAAVVIAAAIAAVAGPGPLWVQNFRGVLLGRFPTEGGLGGGRAKLVLAMALPWLGPGPIWARDP